MIPWQREKPAIEAAGLSYRAVLYAAFFAALTRAQRARCAAAILILPAAEIVRFTIVMPVVFADPAPGFAPFPTFAHRFFERG